MNSPPNRAYEPFELSRPCDISGISEELAGDTLQYVSALRFTERSIEASEHVMAAISGELPAYQAKRPLAQSLVLAGWVNYPDWSSGTIDELLSSGDIRILTNSAVKKALLAHYSGTRAYRERMLGPHHSSYLEYTRATRGMVPPQQHMAFYRTEVEEVTYVGVTDEDLAAQLSGDRELLLIAEAMFTEWWSLWNMYHFEWDGARELLELLDRDVP